MRKPWRRAEEPKEIDRRALVDRRESIVKRSDDDIRVRTEAVQHLQGQVAEAERLLAERRQDLQRANTDMLSIHVSTAAELGRVDMELRATAPRLLDDAIAEFQREHVRLVAQAAGLVVPAGGSSDPRFVAARSLTDQPSRAARLDAIRAAMARLDEMKLQDVGADEIEAEVQRLRDNLPAIGLEPVYRPEPPTYRRPPAQTVPA